jgi:hypothetical protein
MVQKLDHVRIVSASLAIPRGLRNSLLNTYGRAIHSSSGPLFQSHDHMIVMTS